MIIYLVLLCGGDDGFARHHYADINDLHTRDVQHRETTRDVQHRETTRDVQHRETTRCCY